MQENNPFIKGYQSGIKPDPILTVSQWADKHRVLSSKASAEAGQWRTDRTPYLKEIMDCLSDNSPYSEVVFMKGSQVGATEVGNNLMGYVIDACPGPMLYVMPTVDTARKNSRQRITPLINESPRLFAKVKEHKTKETADTAFMKDFPGGTLVITGANSASGLCSLPIRVVFMDEIERYPQDVDGEGCPIALAEKRTSTFPRKKIFKCSTPTIEGTSRIAKSYKQSDQRKYYVPCPHCGGMQTIEWKRIVWEKYEDGSPMLSTVRFQCLHCDELIAEHHKTEMLAAGEWRAENPDVKNKKLAGFHLSALYSPLGWFSWEEAAQDWWDAQDKTAELKGFINTVLGETWKESGDAPDWKNLYRRRESYPMNTLPQGVLFVTAGVDVQKDRLECEIVGWGRDKVTWSVDYRVMYGDTSSPEVWKELEAVLHESWEHESGVSLPLRMMCVDSGYNTVNVYSWVRGFPFNRVAAIKGSDSLMSVISTPKKTDFTSRGKASKFGLKVWGVGVSLVKSELYGFLRLAEGLESDPDKFGFCHFPMYGEDFFLQLTSEELVTTKNKKGFDVKEWIKIQSSRRNEVLDCRVYARAAAEMVGISRFKEPNWKQLEEQLGTLQPVGDKETAAPKKQIKGQTTVTRRKSTFL